MKRKVAMTLSLLGAVSAALAFQGAPATVKLKLDKAIPNVVRYYRPMRITLTDKPGVALKKEPPYKGKVRYGTIALGDAKDNQIVVALDEPAEGEPTLYIDRNGNGDLTDDSDAAWGRKLPNGQETVFLKEAAVVARYADGTSVDYNLSFYRFSKRLPEAVLYYRNSARIGDVKLGNETYKIALVEETANGRFDDLKNTTVVVDVDRDGKFDGSPNSIETYKANEPFNIGGVTYEVKRVSTSGDEQELAISSRTVSAKVKVEVKVIALGDPAPEFTCKDLEGKPVEFPKFAKGKLVFLDFWATW
jgi:hypothetical protein